MGEQFSCPRSSFLDVSPTHTYFRSEEEAEEYYERNRDFINLSAKDRDVAVFKIVHDEILVKEL